MKTAIVIPTLNAEKTGIWNSVLASVDSQDFVAARKIVVDSESDDATCAVAETFGWECRKIKRGDFNHGKTRDAAVRKLADEGIDTIVFLSQDVILAADGALKEITDYLWRNPVAGCFGRQRTCNEGTLDAWQRTMCYSETSKIKTLKDVPASGMMTIFFSNAFSAWRVSEVIRYGGFPETDFGEDALLAANVLNRGGAVGYCADAIAFHNHPNTLWSLFTRGLQVGTFHRRHPELLRQFGMKTMCFRGKIPCSLWLSWCIKAAGYFFGRMEKRIIPWTMFFVIWFLLIPAIVLYDFPQRDAACRYAPMAEAFARGDWRFAFHPRVTPLLTVCAGVISFLFSCNGYLACQLASALFLSLGIFPFYSGCRRIYGDGNAIASGVLYALCPPLLRLGYFGLRETGSVLGIVLLFYSATVLRERSAHWQGFLWFAVAETVLLLSRGDIAVFAFIAGCALFVWDMFRNRIPWRSVVAGATIIIMLAPQLFYNYRMVGYPVPEVRHAVVLRKICRKISFLKFMEHPHPLMPLDIMEGAYE